MSSFQSSDSSSSDSSAFSSFFSGSSRLGMIGIERRSSLVKSRKTNWRSSPAPNSHTIVPRTASSLTTKSAALEWIPRSPKVSTLAREASGPRPPALSAYEGPTSSSCWRWKLIPLMMREQPWDLWIPFRMPVRFDGALPVGSSYECRSDL